MLSKKPFKSPSSDSSNSESQENNPSKQQLQTSNCLDKDIIQKAPCDSLSVPSNNRQFIRHQLSATEEEHSSDDEESLVLRKKLSSKTKKDLHPLPKKSTDSTSEKPPRGSLPSKSSNFDLLTIDMTGTNNNSTTTPSNTTPSNPTPSSPQKSIHNRFAGAHASFRIRMLQEQHGVKKTGEPVFMTKKRTRDTKSSEFQGGDLNKYTSRTYAIQNGNEIFGDDGHRVEINYGGSGKNHQIKYV